jgi:hypothetical protein
MLNMESKNRFHTRRVVLARGAKLAMRLTPPYDDLGLLRTASTILREEVCGVGLRQKLAA